MKISNRLKLIASFVDDNTNVFDVGCDHALLDIFLVLNKKSIKVIASDINTRPLERAKENIDFYQVSDLVQLNLGDGIENINPNCDTIIISGLGGSTIIDILKKDIDKLNNIKTLIISPHSDIYEVRKYLTSIGYMIADEIITYDQKKPYIIIKFIKGIFSYNDDELFFGPILIKNKSINFIKYYQDILLKDREILKKLPKSKDIIHKQIEEEIKRLDKILKV